MLRPVKTGERKHHQVHFFITLITQSLLTDSLFRYKYRTVMHSGDVTVLSKRLDISRLRLSSKAKFVILGDEFGGGQKPL